MTHRTNHMSLNLRGVMCRDSGRLSPGVDGQYIMSYDTVVSVLFPSDTHLLYGFGHKAPLLKMAV